MRSDVCDLCLADVGEHRAAMATPGVARPDDLRFSDVLAELRAVVDLAQRSAEGDTVAAAGRRAERLLGALRDQFLRDLGAPVTGSAGAGAR